MSGGIATLAAAAAAGVTETVDLETAIRHAAIAGAVKDKAIKEAKAAIPDGTAVTFDFTARFQGTLTKGHATVSPAREVTNPAKCDLFQPGVIAQVMRKCGVTSADIRKHLKAIVKKALTDDGKLNLPQVGEAEHELLSPFIDVAAETVTKLPAVKTQVAASSVAGAVKVNMAGVQFIGTPPA